MAKLAREEILEIVEKARRQGVKPDLRGVDLSEAHLKEANLSRTDLTGANFFGTDLSRANLFRADLTRANLNETDIYRADLFLADLSGANLSRANLIKANLTEAKLANTNFSNAFIGDTIFAKVDLSQAIGLATVMHKAPSIIDINTIHKSKDKIPKEFLEQAGVHPDIIRWQHSLHTRPTVFISYNHKDEKEKDQLLIHLRALERNDLIDVWHDARIQAGADWKQEIKQAIAQASVAILLISANFLASDFINEEEIPQFLTRRKSDEKLVIFPIIAKQCAWRQLDWLADMQVRPKGGQAIWGKSQDIDIDTELAKIATEVEEIIKDLWLRGD